MIRREEIENFGKSVYKLHSRVVTVSPSYIAILCGPFSDFNLALISLVDSAKILHECNFALGFAFDYKKKAVNSNKIEKAFPHNFGLKFFCDDIALRLYAVGEHLAHAIMYMLALDNSDILKNKKNKISVASQLGKYLIKECPNHQISKILLDLMKDKSWGEIIKYRNVWVHEQPPLTNGMGIGFRKEQMWKIEKDHEFPKPIQQIAPGKKDRYIMNISPTGSSIDYTLDELFDMAFEACVLIVKTQERITDYYFETIDERFGQKPKTNVSGKLEK